MSDSPHPLVIRRSALGSWLAAAFWALLTLALVILGWPRAIEGVGVTITLHAYPWLRGAIGLALTAFFVHRARTAQRVVTVDQRGVTDRVFVPWSSVRDVELVPVGDEHDLVLHRRSGDDVRVSLPRDVDASDAFSTAIAFLDAHRSSG